VVTELNSKREYVMQFGSQGSGQGQFQGIGGVAVNSAGDVYATDVGGNRVQEFSPAGRFLAQFGAGALYAPTGVAVDASGNVWVLSLFGQLQEFSSEGAVMGTRKGSFEFVGLATGLAISGGNLYVVESLASRVREFSPTTGEVLATFDTAGSGSGKSRFPWGIATDPRTGNVYVSEPGNDRVQEFTPAGSYLAAFGSEGAGSGQFKSPEGIAVAATGRPFVADTANGRVQEWLAPAKAGEAPVYAASFTGPVGGSFREPGAVAVDGSGDTWVADAGHSRVLQLGPTGQYLAQVGSQGSGPGQFQGIRGIATNTAGDLYVCDYGNGRVQEFGPKGEYLRQFGAGGEPGHLLYPSAVTVDATGNVWVLSFYGVLQEFSATGEARTRLGEYESFSFATGLAVSAGNLYVVEYLRSRVRELNPATGSLIRTIDQAGSETGKSRFPWGIATDPSSGNLYISEPGNSRVQAFTPEGTYLNGFGTAGTGEGQFANPTSLAIEPNGDILITDTTNNRIQEWVTQEGQGAKIRTKQG